MSKKIIYLLSLLMALSLVFASCKKTNGITGGDLPGDEPNNIKPPTEDLTGGLFTEQTKLDQYADKVIQTSEIAKYKDKNYMRNPVVTVIDGQTVVVFYEVRYQSPGSANDTALTGTNTVDIVYTVSTDAGVSFDTSTGINYVGGQKATGPSDSHGAPVVFYDKKNSKLVVVASAGIGLGVGSYSETDETKRSKLQYSVADVSGGNVGVFGDWQDITVDLSGINNGGFNFKQFGTHAARGVVSANNELLLPVTLANFTMDNIANTEWGYILFTASGNGTYNFQKQGTAVKMKLDDGTKTTRIAATKDSGYIALTVSDNRYSDDPANLRLFSGAANDTTTTATVSRTTIQAADGAAGTLVVKDWKGATSYDPQAYATSFDTASGTPQAILSHVERLEKQLTIRRVNTEFTTQEGSSFSPDEAYVRNSKSSSLDMLKDGTIVLVAEGGQVAEGVQDGAQRPFFIHFYRYTQAYLTSQTK